MGVIVLGMHRSGTSAAARVINLLGVPFGQGRLVPTDEGNPLGHWESWELQDLNDDLLGAFRGNWAGPPVLAPGWEHDPRAEGLRARAAAVWSSVHPREPWLWKDPRTCLTLAFWRRVVAPTAVAVIVHRHPLEVASSLAVRNEFSTAVSLALWERYTRDALIATAGWPVLVVGYDELVGDPVGWTERVRRFLIGQGMVLSPDGAGSEQAAGAVVPVMRHRRAAAGDEGTGLSASQLHLLSLLGALDGEHERFALAELGPATPWMDAILTEHGRSYEREKELRAELARARNQLGFVINRTRLKVLTYRAYRRLLPRRHGAVRIHPRHG